MIGHCQAGRDPTPELALRPAPLPKFEGLATGAIQPPPGPPSSAIQPQTSGSGGPVRVPALTPDKVVQYATLFQKSGAEDGILPGEQARVIFERAGLPNETLGRIWNLADTEQRGALTETEFIIAMHLLACSKSGTLRALPTNLPAGLYEAAARRPPSRQSSGIAHGAPPAVPPIPRQFSGAAAGRTASPLSRPGFSGPVTSQQTGLGTWAISPQDKARFDQIYDTLDTSKRGFITGEEAVPFFSNSKLPEEVLAQIWDLADINSQGQLSRDEFAVAMYLIRQQRGMKDGRNNLPDKLPAELVPPIMRNQARAPQQPTAPDFDAVVSKPIAKSAADDLFGLDAMASPAVPAAVQQPLSTGGSGFGADPFGNNKMPVASTSPVRGTPAPLSAQGTGFKPFVPSSSFGQTLTSQATGTSQTSNARAPSRGSPMDDLLGDNDPETSKKLTDESGEIANLRSQTGILEKQVHGVQGQRANAQQSLTQAQNQKRELEGRLAQLKQTYENEAKEVRSLNEQFQASRTETQKLQQEMAKVESSYQELQHQHQQIIAALQADQQENASLKERIRELNAEITQLKPQLEKLRSDARQQKGLVAINRKQLLTNEGERDKLNSEAEELNKNIEEDKRALAATPDIANPAHARAAAASPTPSTMSASNPFFRRQGSTSEAAFSPFPTPPVPQQTGQSFDNIFGPTFEAAVHTELPPTPMPQTSFKQPQDSQSRPISPPVERAASPQSDVASSGFLPFPQPSQSLSSSGQVSPPGSRFGDSSTGLETPKQALDATPTGSTSGDAREAEGAIVNRQLNNATHTNERSMSDSMPGSFPGESTNSSGSPFPATDPFAAGSSEQPKPTSKNDFDSAFAGFGTKAPVDENEKPDPFGRGQQEFPPLQEIEDDDDSTDSERGFDDDFSPSAAGHSRNQSRVDGATDAKPSDAPPAATSSVPPALEAQASPPPYDKEVSSQERAHAEAAEFSGLLPTREDPTSPSVPNSVPSGIAAQASTAKVAEQPVLPPKNAFDDFDEFDDLEDAKEGDLDDDFADLSMNDRSTNRSDDFNAMFDSTSASKTSAHGNGFGDFTASPTVTSALPSTAAGATSSAPSDNDWDAIFSGLGNSAPNGDKENKKALVDEAFGEPSTGPTTSAATDAGKDKGPEKPQLGRALTEAGEHDDPILKNLTMMGYERKAALAALEKYDYNLERVSGMHYRIQPTTANP